jgi:tuftelin-interacting protein 11
MYGILLLGKGFGDWEKHTKGIGAKLLLQMGYQPGKGLGKNLEGRAQIVEAFVRKGKAAIGAYGPEGGRPKTNKEGGKKVDSDEEAEAEFQVPPFFFLFCFKWQRKFLLIAMPRKKI